MIIDSFDVMVHQLRELPLPPFPALPARNFQTPQVTDADPGLAAFEAAALWRALAAEIDCNNRGTDPHPNTSANSAHS